MNEQQREHSKLYGSYHTGRKLDSIPQKEFDRVAEPGVYIELGTPVVSTGTPTLNFEDFLRKVYCNADVVLIAIPKDMASQLTENKEFIFTDYIAEVEKIIKNNLSSPVSPKSVITVTRPGGKVEIKGKVVTALDASFKYLELGKRYLLFLRYIPQTGTYQSINQGSFQIEDNELLPMTEEAVPGVEGKTRDLTFSVRSLVYTNCN